MNVKIESNYRTGGPTTIGIKENAVVSVDYQFRDVTLNTQGVGTKTINGEKYHIVYNENDPKAQQKYEGEVSYAHELIHGLGVLNGTFTDEKSFYSYVEYKKNGNYNYNDVKFLGTVAIPVSVPKNISASQLEQLLDNLYQSTLNSGDTRLIQEYQNRVKPVLVYQILDEVKKGTANSNGNVTYNKNLSGLTDYSLEEKITSGLDGNNRNGISER